MGPMPRSCGAAGWRGRWPGRSSGARKVVTAVSRELAGWVQAGTGRFVEPAHVHPMPADTERFSWTTGGGGAVVLARLTPQKRVHLAIEAVAALAAAGHELPLTIIGDGPERAGLERLVAGSASCPSSTSPAPWRRPMSRSIWPAPTS